MTFFWLLFWLLSDTPHISFHEPVSNWSIALAVCLALDILSGGSAAT